MLSKLITTLIVLLFCIFTSYTYATHAELEFRECAFSASSLNILPAQLQCGLFRQKEKQKEKQKGNQLEVQLPFVIIKASAYTNADELLIVVPGGPGYGSQTSTDTIKYWYQYFSPVSRNFDLLLFEPRGTPNATPSLECKHIQRTALAHFATDLTSSQEYASLFKTVSSCVKELDKGGPVIGVSSQQQANDLETLIALTSYKQVHLLGESWGTRVVLQTHSEKVVSRILDSPYPPGKGGTEDWINSVDLRFDTYRNYFSNFDKLWRQAVEALDEKSLTGSYKTDLAKPYDEIKYVVNEHRLAELAFYALYHENMRMPFYNALMYMASSSSSAENPNTENLNKESFEQLVQAYLHSYFDPAFSPLAWYAAECAERSRISKKEFFTLKKHYAKYNYILAGMWEYDVCQLPEFQFDENGPANKELNKELNVDSPLPTLILSGQYDPVTPSHWAIELAEAFGEKASLYVAKGAGHGILSGDYCRASLLVDFISRESVKKESIHKEKVKPTDYCD